MGIFGNSGPGMGGPVEAWMNQPGGMGQPQQPFVLPGEPMGGQPQQHKGLFGQILKTLASGALDGVAMHYGGQPAGYLQMQQQAEDAKKLQQMITAAQIAAQQRRMNNQDAREEFTYETDYKNAHQAPPQASPEERLYSWYHGLDPNAQNDVAATLDRLRPKVVGDPLSGYQFAPRPGGQAPHTISPEEFSRGQPMGMDAGIPGGSAATLTQEQYRGLVAGLGGEAQAQAYLRKHGISEGGR